MAIDAKDILDVATACMPDLLAKALPDGNYRFGGEFASPHPNASAKRWRDYRSDIVVRSSGAWADNLSGARGRNIVELLAHLQNKTLGQVGVELMRTLNPADAMRGQIVPPGLTARTKDEDSYGVAAVLTKADEIRRRDGGTRADALFKVAQEQAPRRKFRHS
jgi:hypothetical protein